MQYNLSLASAIVETPQKLFCGVGWRFLDFRGGAISENPIPRTASKSHMKGLFVGEKAGKNSLISLDFIGQHWTNKNADLAFRAVSTSCLVEMGESRTPGNACSSILGAASVLT